MTMFTLLIRFLNRVERSVGQDLVHLSTSSHSLTRSLRPVLILANQSCLLQQIACPAFMASTSTSDQNKIISARPSSSTLSLLSQKKEPFYHPLMLQLRSTHHDVSSSRPKAEPAREVIISPHLKLYPSLRHDASPWGIHPHKVLVLFFPWLNAQEKHLRKYRELYLSRGLDVLMVNSELKQFLWPPSSKELARHTLKALNSQCQQYEHFLIHSMSIGSYNLTVLRMMAQENEFRGIHINKVCGLVYDSIVAGSGDGGVIHDDSDKSNKIHGLERMLNGIAAAGTNNAALAALVKMVGKLYMTATKKTTVDFYTQSLEFLKEYPVLAPTLFFAQQDDFMCEASAVEALVKIWREKGVSTELQMWEKSGHAQHLAFHAEEYKETLEKFLSHVFDSPELIKKASFSGNI